MNDNAKIILKQQLEEHDAKYKEYEERDDPVYPGWTFLLKDVVKAYGICPYLNVWDPGCHAKRQTWLEGQPDAGQAYASSVTQMSDESVLADIERDMVCIKSSIESYVRSVVERVHLPDEATFESLIENVCKRRDAKSQNKKSKECWAITLRCLDVLAQEAGIDFAKYVHIHTGYHFKYRVPELSKEAVDTTFTQLSEKYTQAQGRLHSLRIQRERECASAKKHLASLILDNFRIEQVGRYWRRWSALTPEKREERISSYCYWYMRQRDLSVLLAEQMKDFIIGKLEAKELKVHNTGLDWNGKQGIVVTVPVTYEDDGFRLITDMSSTARASKKKRSSKRKGHDIFLSDSDKDVQTRANRLLLYEILRTGCVHRDKVVSMVMRNIRTRKLSTNGLRGYLGNKFDEIVGVIKANPVPSASNPHQVYR